MSEKRRQLYAITRELRRWLDWQGGDDAMGAIPASEETRQLHRERAKARRKAKMEAIQSSIRGDEPEEDESAQPPPAATEGDEAAEADAPDSDDDSGVWQKLGSRRVGGEQQAGSGDRETGGSGGTRSSNGEGGQQGGSGGAEAPETNAEKLQWLRDYMGDCRRCPLWQDRTNLVFGEGDPETELVFVGEAPGYNEDQTGRPFVGRAGKLLDQMIRAMGLERDDVYICNVLKSRPPDNRDPRPDEIAECKPFLLKQLGIIDPEVIVTLGRPATQNLLETDRGIGELRGRWQEYDGTDVMPTYHPAYLLRNESQKANTWSDLQQVMERLELG